MDALAPRASVQDGSYPRPQLVRPRWVDLSGPWEFEHGDAAAADLDSGRLVRPLTGSIQVPFPPESPASGVGRTEHAPVVWYRRWVTTADVAATGFRPGDRLLLHLGAVDHRADVWAGGHHRARHEGGHTPFSVDVTSAAGADFDVVVRAEDDPLDVEQPRGKQDWQPEPHVIWYHRTTGIWQPVWLEAVPRQHVRRLEWWPDVVGAAVTLRLELAEAPAPGTAVRVTLDHGAHRLARVTGEVGRRRAEIRLPLEALRNGQDHERLLWSPENPVLLDARIEVLAGDPAADAPPSEALPSDTLPSGAPPAIDTVTSYLGLRTVGTEDGAFLLNDRPYPVRGVLSQGYWPRSHLAAPDPAALRAEVELIRELGFTTARVHQKIEDPRFLYWADRLGLLVWAELPSAFEFSETSVGRLTREWLEVIRRDASHPCVVVWVPLNESWGVQHIAHDDRQLHLARSLYHLTKALDPTRLVVSNDGWEHAESDLLTIHDYENSPDRLAASYADASAVADTVAGVGPGRRRVLLLPADRAPVVHAAPVVLSEFGGVSLRPAPGSDGWGYREVATPAELRDQVGALFAALHASRALAGWCYTQLTDTAQETNGLTDEHRVPKLPAETIRAMVTGTGR